jgi:HK97 family phage portal protein
MVEFIQGPKSYHPAMQELERKYRPGKLAHGGDPVLAWCASNLVPRYDANSERGAGQKARRGEDRRYGRAADDESPHPEWTAAAFWQFIVSSFLLYGDGYARIMRPYFSSNQASGFEPIHPNRIKAYRLASGGVGYRTCDEKGREDVLDPADVLHFPSLGFDGLKSMSMIRYAARNAVSLAMSADEYSNAFFRNGARPDFVLRHPGVLKDDAVDKLRETWARRYGGVYNAHMPAVLTGGMEVEQLTMSAEDAQLISTRGMQIEEIARLFGVPPFMIGHNEKTTSWGSGVESMGTGFTKYTLARHLKPCEQELNRKLWPSRAKYFAEFNTAGLERGDFKTRMAGYRSALGRAGEPAWMRVDEVRKLENMAPDAELEALQLTITSSPGKSSGGGSQDGGDNADNGDNADTGAKQ